MIQLIKGGVWSARRVPQTLLDFYTAIVAIDQ